jgi:hypothetical protein
MVKAILDERIHKLALVSDPPTSAQRLLSNANLLAEILNTCFWASLSRNEGRPIASGITLVSPETMRDLAVRGQLRGLESLVLPE